MSEQGRHSHTDHDSSFITECPFKRRCIETSAPTAQSESIGGVNNLKSGVTEYTDQLQSPGGLQKQRPDNASIIPVLPSANKNEKTSLGLGIQGEYDHLPKGEPRANEASPDYMAKFDEIILTYMKDQKIPGVSLVIGKGQDILYSQCYGWASHGVPVRSDHLFRIASISKVFTAVAVLKLHEDGKLRLTDRVFGSKGLLKQLKSGGGFLDRRVLKITVSHLLRHCGGWDRELAGDPCFWKHIGQEMGVEGPVDPSTLIVYMLERQKLQFNPGSRYAYSNFGYLVLGRVVEAVSGQNYGSYVQQILAQANIPGVKLGKTRKREADQREVEYFALPQHVSVESVFPGEGKVASPYGSYAMESGDSDGGWLSTPLHLLQLLQSIEGSRKPKILKPETFKSMLQRPRYAKGDTAWYGMGLDVAWNKKAWEHSGHIDGATGVLAHDRSGYMWSFLANYWPADSDYTSLMTYAVASTHRWSRPKLHRAIECNAATVDRKYSVQLSVPHADICSRLQSVQSQEYSLTWVNSYVVENTTYFNLVAKQTRQEPGSLNAPKSCWDMCREELLSTVNSQQDKGYNLAFVDSYRIHDKIRYAAIFSRDCSSHWALFENLPVEELGQKNRDMQQKGYSPKVLSVVASEDGTSVCVLYLKGQCPVKSWPQLGMTLRQYEGEARKRARYGHLLSYMKSYHEHALSQIKFSLIWTDPGPYRYTVEHDMSKFRVLNDILRASELKFSPLFVCGYDGGDDEVQSSHKFAAVCLKPVPSGSV